MIFNLEAKKQWWGESRIDYVLYAPERIANLPKKSLPYIFHSCYWESNDVAAFVLRELFKQDKPRSASLTHTRNSLDLGVSASYQMENGGTALSSSKETGDNSSSGGSQKWRHRFNRVKLRVS